MSDTDLVSQDQYEREQAGRVRVYQSLNRRVKKLYDQGSIDWVLYREIGERPFKALKEEEQLRDEGASALDIIYHTLPMRHVFWAERCRDFYFRTTGHVMYGNQPLDQLASHYAVKYADAKTLATYGPVLPDAFVWHEPQDIWMVAGERFETYG